MIRWLIAWILAILIASTGSVFLFLGPYWWMRIAGYPMIVIGLWVFYQAEKRREGE